MENGKNVPKLRFPGVDGEWEQCKYSEVIELLSGQDFEPSDYNDEGNGLPYMTGASCIVDGKTEVTRWTTTPKCIANKGDVLLVCKGSGCGTIAVLSQEKAHIARQFMALKCGDMLDNTFNLFLANSVVEDIKKDARGLIAGIARDAVLKQTICIPKIEEQTKIGKYFSKIDNLITLQQRKVDSIKEYKKGMLQKMFPKKGAKVPEIRFPGFTDEWEQRKLGDMLDRYEDPVETPHDGYERIGIRSHAKGVFHSYVEPGKELDTAKMHRVAADKFILNITFAWEHAVAITEEEEAGTLVSHRFPQFSFHKDLKSHFFKFLMLDQKFREYLELCSPGGAGRNRVLNINDMLKYKINVPSVEEQTKIGEYFDNIDNLITLNQRKLEEYRKLKKGLLQQLFI